MDNIKTPTKDEPIHPITGQINPKRFIGLSKREYFAAMVMQGYLSGSVTLSADFMVSNSVRLADRLIKELEETK